MLRHRRWLLLKKFHPVVRSQLHKQDRKLLLQVLEVLHLLHQCQVLPLRLDLKAPGLHGKVLVLAWMPSKEQIKSLGVVWL
jgi:hypothetical protein